MNIDNDIQHTDRLTDILIDMRTVKTYTLHTFSFGVLAAQPPEVHVYIDRYIYTHIYVHIYIYIYVYLLIN